MGMASENILKFKNNIYNRMKNENLVYSAYKLYSEYSRHYGFDHTKEEIFDFFVKDNRFLPINKTQLLLKEIVDNLIQEDFYGKEIQQIADYIRQKYFISTIDETIIAELVNKFKKDNKLVLEYSLSKYEIRNKGDFDKAILREGKISYVALEQISEFLDIGVPELMMELDEKNVFMNDSIGVSYKIYSGKINCDTSSENNSNRFIKEQEHLATSEVKIKHNNKDDKQCDNILTLDLHPNEFLASLLALVNYLDSDIIDSSYFSSEHMRSLKKMGIVDCNKSMYSLTVLGKELVERFNISIKKNMYSKVNLLINTLVNRYYSTNELSKSIEIKIFDQQQIIWDEISDILINIYYSNYYSRAFINLIMLSNENNGISMKDIFDVAIKNDKYKELSEVLIGDKSSSGIKPIVLGKDICLKCDDTICCQSNEKKAMQQRLLYYRNEYVDKFINEVKQDNLELDLIRQDPLLIKFIVPYTLCVVNKKMMMRLNIIEKSDILYKDAGQYCPAKDKWVINNDLLVQRM